MYEVLNPLSVLTDGLSAEKEMTVSAILPLLHHLNGSILNESPLDSKLAKEMKKVIMMNYNQGTVEKTSFLDPRFRGKHLSDSNTTVSSLKQECLELTELDEVDED